MLKPRQVKKLLLSSLPSQSEFHYQGCARGVHYLRHGVPNPTDPRHNLAALSFDEKTDSCTLALGSAFFDQPAQLAMAPSFSRWQSRGVTTVTFSSKQSARRAVAGMLDRLESAGFATTYRALKEDRTLRDLFTFFESSRQQLSSPDSAARAQLKQRATPQLYNQLVLVAEHQVEWKDDDALDSFLESLGGEGDFQGTAAFTLNRDEAVRKLADYQLSDPVLLPLFLALGLTLAGASKLSIEVDSDETWVRFEGTRLADNFLEDIPSRLLATAGDDNGLALQALGRALLQGASHAPAALQLETPSGVIDLRGFPDSFPTVSWGQPQQGTFYHKRRFGLDVASRYWRSRRAPHSEIPELLRALHWLPAPWSINGQSPVETVKPELTMLWRYGEQTLPEFTRDATFLELESPIPGSVLFRFQAELPARLAAVLHHQVVELPPQTRFPPTTDTVIWLPEMATDLSGRRLVESQLLCELLDTLGDLQDQAWHELTRRFPLFEPARKRAWIAPLLGLWQREPRLRPLLERELHLPTVGGQTIPLGRWLEGKPRLHCREPHRFTHPLLNGEPVVSTQPAWQDELGKVAPDMEDGSTRLAHTAGYYRERAKWLSLPTVPLTAPSEIAAHLKVMLPQSLGYVWVAPQRAPARDLLVEGRPLPYEVPQGWAPPFVGFRVAADGIEMDWDWRYPVPTPRVEALRGEIASHLTNLIQAMADPRYLTDELARSQFCYLLAFHKSRGHSIRGWENIPFIPFRGGTRSLREDPDHLLRFMADL